MIILVRENSQGIENGEGDREGNWKRHLEGSEINGITHSTQDEGELSPLGHTSGEYYKLDPKQAFRWLYQKCDPSGTSKAHRPHGAGGPQ